MPRGDGLLIGVTTELSEEVIAWHEHTIAGTNAFVESACVTPTDDGDELWLSVRRTVNGNTSRYIEILKERNDETLEDAFFVDSGLTYSGAAATLINGLDHLEGETVTILADGATHPTKVVSGGAITLDREATKAHIGLGYVSKIHSLAVVGGSAKGSSVGKPMTINRIYVQFYKTSGAKIGTNLSKMDVLSFRGPSDPMDAPPPLFTGIRKFDPDSGYKEEAQVFIEQHLPLPWTVVGYGIDFEVNE